jgi:hypothetical protein
LGLVAGAFFVLRYTIPIAAGHPVGRLLMLVVSGILAAFALGFALRFLRR